MVSLSFARFHLAVFFDGPLELQSLGGWEGCFFFLPVPKAIFSGLAFSLPSVATLLSLLREGVLLLSFPFYLGSAAYFRFVLSRRGNRYSHARSTWYRSGQIPWVCFWIQVLLWSSYLWGRVENWSVPWERLWGALPAAYSGVTVYYALRFGSLRWPAFVFYLMVILARGPEGIRAVGESVVVTFFALVVAFSVDMMWNHLLKRKGVIVPGPDPLPPSQVP